MGYNSTVLVCFVVFIVVTQRLKLLYPKTHNKICCECMYLCMQIINPHYKLQQLEAKEYIAETACTQKAPKAGTTNVSAFLSQQHFTWLMTAHSVVLHLCHILCHILVHTF